MAASTSACTGELSLRGGDLQLTTEDGKTVHVFGVDHIDTQTEIAEFIMEAKPAAVVVETAIHAVHGEACGNVARCGEEVEGFDGMFQAQFSHVGTEFAAAPDYKATEMWTQACIALNGEQLAYCAAFAVGASVVFGDRPKAITYQRLANMPTLVELDRAFEATARANYEELLAGGPRPYAPDEGNCFDRIMMLEREVCMAHAIRNAAADAPEGASVVAVIGSDHLPGIADAWAKGKQDFLYNQLLEVPQPDSSLSDAEHGARRGLLECVMNLRVPTQVLVDLNGVVGMPSEGMMETADMTVTTWGHPRMLLAVQEEEFLPKVCGGLSNTKMYDHLARLRAVRPTQGGKGYDAEALDELMCMAYDFSAYGDPRAAKAA